jgi:acetate kinase
MLHLVLRRGVTPDELLATLEKRSGLLGVSGISGDLREVIAAADAGHARARLAYDQLIVSLRRALGAMAGVLGGVDAVVFTGGIGENSARVRADGAAALAFAGLRVDEARNLAVAGDAEIGAAGATARAFVIRAREDLVILREVAGALGWVRG